jgi:hypothetical protein
MIAITLPDGSVKQFESETTPMGVAISISEGFELLYTTVR